MVGPEAVAQDRDVTVVGKLRELPDLRLRQELRLVDKDAPEPARLAVAVSVAIAVAVAVAVQLVGHRRDEVGLRRESDRLALGTRP